MATGDFFSVGRDTFHRACDLGINPACALLVLARGSGGDNATSSWSSNAIAERCGVRWSVAKEAIAQLEGANLIKIQGTRLRPKYKIERKGDDLWLPNSLVDGVSNSRSPVLIVRQSQDPLLLRLYIDLYGDQNLREYDGIATDVTYRSYARKRLGQHAQYVVWGFDAITQHAWKRPTTTPHYRDLSPQEVEQGHTGRAVDFFKRFGMLAYLGLVEEVPMLYESETGEPIHPIYTASRIGLEARLGFACQDSAFRALSWEHHEILDKQGWPDIVACVPAHIEQVTVIGTYRLTFRPHTSLTGAWMAHMKEAAPDYIRRYEAIAPDVVEVAKSA